MSDDSDSFGFGWSYRMIKVGEEFGDDIGMIAEVVYGNDGEVQGFSKASLISITELNMAHKDILSQNGELMTYFWDNGTFTHTADWNGEEFIHTYKWQPTQEK